MKRIFLVNLFFWQMFAMSQTVLANETPLNKKSNFELKSQVRLENLNQDHYQTTHDNDQYTDSSPRANIASRAILNNKWFLEVQYRAEKLRANTKDNKNYEDVGSYIRDMTVGYDGDNILIYAGKFRPYFGIAWRNGTMNWLSYTQNNLEQFDYNNTRGIWTDYLANNYAQTEKLGAAAVLKAGDDKTIGKYELAFSAFTNDRKNFDNSLMTSRLSSHKTEGQAGDSRSLKSLNLSLDVSYDFKNEERLFYRFAYINLDVNSLNSAVSFNKVANQKGFDLSMNYQKPITANFNLNGLIEYVEMKNVGGNSDVNDIYFNSSLVANIFQNWNITTAYNQHKNRYYDFSAFDQNMIEISGGYRFDKCDYFDSLLLQIGYRNLRNDYKSSIDVRNSYAFLLRYIKNF